MNQMRTPVAMEASSGVRAAPCSGGGDGARAPAEAEAATGGRRRRGVSEVRGLEGREWESEMGLEAEERRRREKEREGSRGWRRWPRLWQVSGEAAVEAAMAQQDRRRSGGNGEEREVWGLSGWTVVMAWGAWGIRRIGPQR
jgi:hypothetical protein